MWTKLQHLKFPLSAIYFLFFFHSLPTFHMAAAVEVLTLGTYSRLPAVIRERLVPPPPLTPAERRSTLRALAHVVRQRLTTASLPSDVRNLKVSLITKSVNILSVLLLILSNYFTTLSICERKVFFPHGKCSFVFVSQHYNLHLDHLFVLGGKW